MQHKNVGAPAAATMQSTRLLARDEVGSVLSGLEHGFDRDSAATTGVAVLLGSGAKLKVERGHLVASDGEGWYRRERRWNRATSGLRRVLIGAQSGYVTLDALAWCNEMHVAVLILDADGEIVLAPGSYTPDDARLRRVQAAPPAGMGVEAARQMVAPKLAGQASVARDRLGDNDAAATIGALTEALARAESVDECRQLEASAAALYWDAWSGNVATTMRFTRADASHIPVHWAAFDGRRSLLARGVSARKAERPLNAVLNLLYKLAEIEASLASLAVGLDPGLGVVHTDMARRDSLALDLLEPVRPHVDRFVLDLVAERTFTRADFVERSDGSIRIAPRLVQECAATMPAWARAVAPHAEALAHRLGRAMTGKWQPTTRLTGQNLRAAQATVKARKTAAKRAASTAAPARATARRAQADATLFATCLRCGGPLTRPRHLYCETCWDTTPGQSRDTRRRRGQAIATAQHQVRRYTAEHPDVRPDAQRFAPIRDALTGVRLAEIMAATGLSKTSASTIRSGRVVPHVRHWDALGDLAKALTGNPAREDPPGTPGIGRS